MSLRARLPVSLLAGLLFGAALAALSPGNFLSGWLAAGLLSALAVFCLLSAFRAAGGGRALAWMVALAFLLRLALGVAVSLGLPVFGYPEPEQQAGYLFNDAYRRDSQAWDLAASGRPILAAFGHDFTTDQYGGLLALSALVYRVLSPGAHRPFLILILAAFFFALGVPFFFRAVQARWGRPVALLAGWILVLYPDGILFSASQMREPFLIGLACIAFWAIVNYPQQPRRSLLALAASLLGAAVFSSLVAVALAGLLAVWFFLDHLSDRLSRRQKLAAAGGLALLAVLILALTWGWFTSASVWDLGLIKKLSGQWLKALEPVGRAVDVAALAVYGLTRPLLPAAIASVRPPWIWKTIDIFRSAGWYALLPLLLYSLWTVWKARPAAHRRTLIWFAAAVVAWLLISSIRAGADQWDNPRYRTIFIPWMALLAGWGWRRALEQRDPWLLRWVAVEVIFLAFFTQWYLSRYWTWLGWARWPFWRYVFWTGGLSLLVLLGGWWWDRRARRAKIEP